MYDVFNLVIVRLKDELDSDTNHRLHRLIGALFLPNLSFADKSLILEDEFHIEMETDRKELLENMCNLGQGIEDRALERGIKVLIHSSVEDGKSEEVTLSRITEGFEITRDEAKRYYDKYALQEV